MPDIDSWAGVGVVNTATAFKSVSLPLTLAFLDATFFDDNELPGRDMSEIPHPRMVETMEVFDNLPEI